ncbi:MAG: pilus assembly protein TadG-related protein [Pseudomonadota bacterium]
MANFWASNKGNVAFIFALLITPVLLSVGIAVDFTRLQSAKSVVQQAADAAAIAGAKADAPTDADLQAVTKKVFETNLNGAIGADEVTFTAQRSSNGNVVVNANIDLASAFLTVSGHPKLKTHAMSEASVESFRGVELAIGFDATNSMTFGNTWQVALQTLQSVLADVSSHTGNEDLYVTLFPFQDRVPIGPSRSAWLSSPAPSGWEGCVKPREEVIGTFNWALDDSPPTAEPFQPSVRGTGPLAAGLGSNYPNCPSTVMTGPTNNVSSLILAAGTYSNSGTGRFDVALAWLWRLLSPNWNGLWGIADYPALDTSTRRKIAVFITDGRSEAYRWELSADPTLSHNKPGSDAGEHMVFICDQMKAQGIEVWAIRIQGNSEMDPYFQDCASQDSYYHVVDGSNQLALVFDELGSSLKSDIRLVR